jgi:hypothetical protein
MKCMCDLKWKRSPLIWLKCHKGTALQTEQFVSEFCPSFITSIINNADKIIIFQKPAKLSFSWPCVYCINSFEIISWTMGFSYLLRWFALMYKLTLPTDKVRQKPYQQQQDFIEFSPKLMIVIRNIFGTSFICRT